jgi:predicted secreted protein
MPEASYTQPLETLFAPLGASRSGLSEDEAAVRLGRYGTNRLETAPAASPWKLLAEQFRNVLIITLLVATVLSAFLGHGVEAIAIAVIVLFAVLPWGVRPQGEEGAPGTDPGAPLVPRLGAKLLWTTAIATLVFAACAAVYINGLVTFDDLTAWMGMPR